MKNRIILLLVFFVSIQVANSQVVEVQFGENWSYITGVNGKQITYCPKPFLGQNVFIGFEYMNRKFLNLSSKVGYITKKAEEDYKAYVPNGGWIPIVNKIDLGYLTINTTLDFKYPITDRFFPFISVGPRIDYLMNMNKKESTLQIMHPLVLGFTLGGGLKFMVSMIYIGLHIDNYWNFYRNTKLGVIAYPGTFPPLKMNERIFLLSFSVGYKLK